MRHAEAVKNAYRILKINPRTASPTTKRAVNNIVRVLRAASRESLRAAAARCPHCGVGG